ncbi:MAG: outer membrane protein assembly factor BamA [Proteobacteria bacterium]|nr:outer membrane protein assembly factor BamA [Pseudomonadota bacterium]
MRTPLARLFFVALSTTCLAVPAFAATVTDVSITGNERVEPETIRTYLPFKKGGEFDPAQTGYLVRSLYATGLFSNVEVSQDAAGVVTVHVVENPMVNRVAFEGNKEIDSKRLEELTSLKARSIYSPAKVQADVQALQSAYRSRSRFTTTVKAQLIQRDQNRVDVIYNITEGEKTRIARINFVGNKKFSDSDLSEVIATKTSAWWRFLSSADSYDPARIDVDRDLLRRYYLSKGYADVQITSAVAELSRDKKSFIITYTVYEGPRYNFGAVDLTLKAEAEGLDMKALGKDVTLKPGELFNAKRVDDNTDKLIDDLGNKGFAFLDVKPAYTKHEAERTVDVTYAITPGPRVYVNRINIEGNTRTRDNVIRREMRLSEGDAYSAEKLKRSKDRLTYLGYFEKVDVTRQPADEPDRMNVDVKVKEQSTGEFNVGAGYSTFDGILATASVKENNFLGKGQQVALDMSVSQRQQNFNIGFTEPYFMGQELAAGADAFNTKTDYQSESGYDTAVNGADVRLGFPLSEFAKNDVRLGYKTTKIENVGSAASQFVKAEAGSRSSAMLSNIWSYDNRDSTYNPTRGYRISLGGDYSGFGSDTDFLRANLSGTYNHELFEDWVLTLGGRAGIIEPTSGQLPLYEHFSGGGQTLRGFEFGGIGPRDKITGDALGGKYMLGNTVELGFPLGATLTDMGVRGVLFTDGGIVTKFDQSSPNIIDSKTYRITTGAGINWRSPLGPLRLELGFPLVKASEDRTQIFSFSVGTRF